MAIVEKQPKEGQNPPPIAERKRKPGPGRPPADKAQEIRDAKGNRFADTVAGVAPEDWGARAVLWLYRLEPYTDRKRAGDNIYLLQYTEPVDEQRVMNDFGSGRYRLMLTIRKPGAEKGDSVDKYEFEINNQNYPPKIPAGEWVDDPRNIKWAWARPFLQAAPNGMQPQQQQPATPAAPSVLDTVHAVTAMQESADRRAEMLTEAVLAARPQGNSIQDAITIVTALKGGGETELMKMMGAQLERAMNRAEKMEDELRKVTNAPAAQPKTLAEQVKELVDIKTGLGNFFGTNGEAKESAATASRSRMSGWMEFFQPVVPEVISILKPFAAVAAQGIMMKMQQANQARPPQPQPAAALPPATITPASNGTPTPAPQPAAPTAPTPQDNMMEFINQITPRMINHLVQGIDGGTFAAWIADGYSVERVQQMQSVPPALVVETYKNTPYWSQLADRETSFVKFLEEFNAWKPEESEPENEDEEEPAG